MELMLKIYTNLTISGMLILATTQQLTALQVTADVQEHLNSTDVPRSDLSDESTTITYGENVPERIIDIPTPSFDKNFSGYPMAPLSLRQWPFTYMKWGNPDCPSDTEVLVWIHSRPPSYASRQRIRKMWTRQRHFSSLNLRLTVRFFMGETGNESTNKMVRYESEKYADIVQESYDDTYRNLSYKAVSALHWVTLHCNITTRLAYVLKTDDDVLVDLPNLHSYLQRATKSLYPKPIIGNATWYPSLPSKDWFACSHVPKTPVYRERTNKWFVSKLEHPGTFYPPHCHGYGVVMSPTVISRLRNAVKLAQWLWVDDVYFTGYLAKDLDPLPVYIQAVGFEGETSHFKEGELKKWMSVLHCGNHANRHISQYWRRIEARYVRLNYF